MVITKPFILMTTFARFR